MEQIKYWYRKYLPEQIRSRIRKLIPFWIELNYFVLASKNFNLSEVGHGEAFKLKEICKELDIKNGYYVDIGASDGFTSSTTYIFAKDKNFSGLSIELDNKKFLKMKKLYKKFNNANLLKEKITPDNVVDSLLRSKVPIGFDILNLDIDSYDLFVIDNLLSVFKPKIISMEINEKIPPPLYFSVLFDDQHFWKGDHFFGCSLQAANDVVCKYNYKLLTLKYNNAIFINTDTKLVVPDLTVSEIYNLGYKDQKDRKTKFSYNHDVDIALEMENDEAVKFFNQKFIEYKGMYVLKVK